MTPVAVELTPKEDQRSFERVVDLVRRLPDIDLGREQGRLGGKKINLTCHILASALSRVTNLEVIHGEYVRFYSHSWLLAPKGSVIDPYPVAMLGGPIMVAQDGFPSSPLPGMRLYFPANEKVFRNLYSKMFASDWFKRSVDRIEEELLKL